MDSQEFSSQLEKLNSEIFHAALSYKIYVALHPTKEIVDTLNRRRGFFIPVRSALYQIMIIGLTKIFDRDRRTMSLVNLLREAKKAPAELVPYLSISDIQTMEEQLSQHEPVLKKLKTLRDQQLAHNDAKPKPSTWPTKREMDNLIKTIEEIFNNLSSGHKKSVYSWEFQKNRSVKDTDEILRILKEEMEKRKAESDKLINDLEDIEQ